MLIAENISKKIRGNVILDNVSLELKKGTIYGFCGKNGSGKTMLFRALSGLMKVSKGRVLIDGQELNKDIRILPSLGIVLENAGLYPEFTGIKNLRLLANINKIIGDNEIRNAITRVGLDPNDKRPFRKYSLGMKQRIVIAQAIMESPEILMLDEPTNGLDDDGVIKIRNIIKEEKDRGAIVLMNSHDKEDIALLADERYRMAQGVVEREEMEQ